MNDKHEDILLQTSDTWQNTLNVIYIETKRHLSEEVGDRAFSKVYMRSDDEIWHRLGELVFNHVERQIQTCL